jgi:hypothetical protein
VQTRRGSIAVADVSAPIPVEPISTRVRARTQGRYKLSSSRAEPASASSLSWRSTVSAFAETGCLSWRCGCFQCRMILALTLTRLTKAPVTEWYKIRHRDGNGACSLGLCGHGLGAGRSLIQRLGPGRNLRIRRSGSQVSGRRLAGVRKQSGKTNPGP